MGPRWVSFVTRNVRPPISAERPESLYAIPFVALTGATGAKFLSLRHHTESKMDAYSTDDSTGYCAHKKMLIEKCEELHACGVCAKGRVIGAASG